MKLFKKNLALVLALVLALSLAGCGQRAETAQPEEEAPAVSEEVPAGFDVLNTTVRLAALKGPTAMGVLRMLDTAEVSSLGPYFAAFTLAASADEVTPALIKGDLDMACIPANLAATLYQKTEGEIITLAVNTLGVIYIVENGNAVQSMADLKGKTIVAAGKGSTPEYALRYLLEQNGVDPDADVTIDWKSEHSECVAALATGAATIALLPQPFVTVAQGKIDSLRVALDLTAEWDALDNGSGLITGVLAVRKTFAEEHPAVVEAVLQQYRKSVNWTNENPADAAQSIVERGILEDAAVAEAALPYCNIVCITDSEMKEKLSGYLEVLFDAEPSSVGGALPGDDFYYGA